MPPASSGEVGSAALTSVPEASRGETFRRPHAAATVPPILTPPDHGVATVASATTASGRSHPSCGGSPVRQEGHSQMRHFAACRRLALPHLPS
jgi:hypothetical protein